MPKPTAEYSSRDPIKAIIMRELEQAFDNLVEPIAKHVAKQLRRDYQYKTRPKDPLRMSHQSSARKPRTEKPTVIYTEGDKLRTLRVEARMSQLVMAQHTNLQQTDISAMELGRKPIPKKVWNFIGLKAVS